MLLDIVEVACSHSGFNLAAAFTKMLEEFGISDKVGCYQTEESPNLPLTVQILSITCDNASSNNTMIDKLEFLVQDFPGAANRARCFTHILNLIVKSIMRQFDAPKANKDDLIDDTMKEWLKLAAEAEEEEDCDVADGDSKDNVKGWIDEHLTMSVEELKQLEEAIQPICFLLTKVGCHIGDMSLLTQI